MLPGVRTLAVLLALTMGDPELIFETEAAKAAFEVGRVAFAEGDYDAAAEAFERANGLEPSPPPQLLYAQAQAERLAGRCVRATPLYIEFLDTQPPPGPAELVQWNLSLCIASMSLDADACAQADAQLERLEGEVQGDETRARQLLELQVRLEACREPELVPDDPVVPPRTESAPPEPVLVTTPSPPSTDRRPVDLWAVGLGSGSLLAAGASVGLFLGSRAQLDAVSLEGTHRRARDRHELGRGMQAGAIAAAAVAGGLAVGALVHWIVQRKRRSASATALR